MPSNNLRNNELGIYTNIWDSTLSGRIVMKYILIVTLLVLPWAIFAAYLEDIPSQVSQPDGSLLSLFASGDEYANYLHDARGYTIIQSPTDGYYY
ncbi:hypothetical protein DSECCO2_524990 [anaerobic digester metagenome]